MLLNRQLYIYKNIEQQDNDIITITVQQANRVKLNVKNGDQ